MLKALELHGFKSFADKTRFEFPDGITVVVGPNGSGKSNVVDGIKWVLGEQSAKSLRGTEMSDVIFKGSGSGQRRQSNTAEVTIVFDNSQSLLTIDSPEVRVTRRVYRSGEGEYLINDEPCRLRDIRDLFRGTGVGTDAYSLIEQGKVDTLLQASPRERRAIFEEAAGISRFKAKKVESQRRLDRVEQNLLRLSDIVEEVDRRLKSLRNQATKARRYKDYTDRLKDLRTHVSLADFRSITEESSVIETQLAALVTQVSTLDSSCQDSDTETKSLDERLDVIKQESRASSQQLAKLRETITGLETTSQLQRQTLLELENEETHCRRKLGAVNSRAGDMKTQLAAVQESLGAAEEEYTAVQSQAAKHATALQDIVAELTQRREAERQQREEHDEQMRAVARLNSELNGLESELSLSTSSIDRDRQRSEQLESELEAATASEVEAEAAEKKLSAELSNSSSEQDKAQTELDALVTEVNALTQELSKCQQERTAAAERSNVLEEVERRLEGIGAGTKDLLAKAAAGAGGPVSEVKGMVADLVEVKVEMAPLVDAALGERAQYVVVTGQRLMRAIADSTIRLRGRVGLISLATLSKQRYDADAKLAGEDGVVGHATEFVQLQAAWSELADYLLGTTWFVHSMDVALLLREKYRSKPWRFVTTAGEILEADGTFFGGPRLSSGGIVSRRSELRSLRAQLTKLTEQENILEQKLKQKQEIKDTGEKKLREWNAVRAEASDKFARVHAKAEAARQLVEQISSNRQTVQTGLVELQQQHEHLAVQQTTALTSIGKLDSLIGSLASALSSDRTQVAGLKAKRQEHEEASTAIRIELAKVEQRVETLRVQALRFEQDNDDRARAVSEIQSQLQQCQHRHRDTTNAILQATSRLALLYIEQHECEQGQRSFRSEEDQIAGSRATKTAEARSWREQLHKLQQSQQALQIHAGELRLKRESVADRVREDYGIELADLLADTVRLEKEGADLKEEEDVSDSEQNGENESIASAADESSELPEASESLPESSVGLAVVSDDDASINKAENHLPSLDQREDVEREIGDLRRKIGNIGAVNMESLAELEELEERFGSLSNQYQDLIQAKETLERIIQRINVDSRRMFVETLDIIRTNFQALFRRAFGGGQADIVVEEDVDILDAGIDIIATPPGKQSLNISLLSGGERALTAVTLLLAIFRHRPSPFCILDEVDGPLDEANIGRFVDVLKEFLETTKVVIVTHSKKTMSASTTLYGVTMQESGVSKRVSVQFNDVREDGSIRSDADRSDKKHDEDAA